MRFKFDPSLVEVITYELPNIRYGDALEVDLNPEEIAVR